MATFKRGLQDDFVNGLNDEYAKDGWWRAFVDDPELFVAIRDNRVNVYYRGCSLVELSWRDREIVGRTHYKYLLRPSMDLYVELHRGEYELDRPANLFLKLPDLDDLKRAARPYASDEKTGVHDIIKANPKILDVEIAFGTTGEAGPSAPRVDFAALQERGDQTELVFFEAKHFDSSELRTKGSEADVVGQMSKYRALLKNNRDAVEEGFLRVCENLRSLDGVCARHPERHATLERIERGGLLIDVCPRLVVFGFDDDQRTGTVWCKHRQKLWEKLGKDKVLLKGDSKDFRRGVSS